MIGFLLILSPQSSTGGRGGKVGRRCGTSIAEGGEGYDGAGEEEGGGGGAVVLGEVGFLFGGGEGGGVAGVEADGDDVEVLAGGFGEGAEGAEQVVEDHGAEHGALVVDEDEDDGFGVEVVFQADLSGG